MMQKNKIKKMAEMALKARAKAYAPYSNHPVGAVILADDGQLYAGCNVESANYKSNCAEESAIAAMIMAGARKIEMVAVVGPHADSLLTPCGSCRQKLREFGDDDMHILSLDYKGHLVRIMTLGELLPLSFGPENLKTKSVKTKKKIKK
jgi:cytidine deaminase